MNRDLIMVLVIFFAISFFIGFSISKHDRENKELNDKLKSIQLRSDSLESELKSSDSVRSVIVHRLDSLNTVLEDVRRIDSLKTVEIRKIKGKYKYLEVPEASEELERKMKDFYVRQVP